MKGLTERNGLRRPRERERKKQIRNDNAIRVTWHTGISR
jgi:hypothetical protein